VDDDGACVDYHAHLAAAGGGFPWRVGREETEGMCRSIHTLRPPVTPEVTDEDIRAAALQYVRKVSGYRAPARRNQAVFDEAVEAVAAATRALLDGLVTRPGGGDAA
jgi:hypothetical protein